MRIALYCPMKPLDHPSPSGDQTTARGLAGFLRDRGHRVEESARLRARWIFAKPWLWPAAALEIARAGRTRADVWLTVHGYYKAPDVIGPRAARAMGVPYAVFQGIYSTKRAKNPLTRPGFLLNRRALLAASVVFAYRRLDLTNLRRLLPEDRLCHVAPGIRPDLFPRDPDARAALRREWGVGERPVILAVAMFRDDVKTRGLEYLITRLGGLSATGADFELVLAGDGPTRERLVALAARCLPGRTRFAGLVPRERLFALYSAADLFVFPGIRESLGMVYLEAQAAGLPVVAFDNGGIPEVVRSGETGLLTPPFDDGAFQAAVASLLADPSRRQTMGRAGEAIVRRDHDLTRNFAVVEERLHALTGGIS